MAGPVEGTLVITGLGPADGGVGLGQGSFRTALGRSGRGASSATRASISCRLLSPCFREDGLVVLRREVPCQQADGGQGQGARSQELEDLWEAPAGSSGLDTVAGGIFGEAKGLGAISEERAVALSGVERRAAIEGGQMGHQLDRGLALLAGEHFQAGET